MTSSVRLSVSQGRLKSHTQQKRRIAYTETNPALRSICSGFREARDRHLGDLYLLTFSPAMDISSHD